MAHQSLARAWKGLTKSPGALLPRASTATSAPGAETLENQIRGLAVVFGVRLPRALTAAFIEQALKVSEGIAGLSAAMRGLIAARTAVMTAVASIDADMRRMTRASGACAGS